MQHQQEIQTYFSGAAYARNIPNQTDGHLFILMRSTISLCPKTHYPNLYGDDGGDDDDLDAAHCNDNRHDYMCAPDAVQTEHAEHYDDWYTDVRHYAQNAFAQACESGSLYDVGYNDVNCALGPHPPNPQTMPTQPRRQSTINETFSCMTPLVVIIINYNDCVCQMFFYLYHNEFYTCTNR